jgi:hypothetical protein
MQEQTESGFALFGIISLAIIIAATIGYIIYKFRNNIFTFLSSPFTFVINFFMNFFKNNEPLINADNCAVIHGTVLPVSRVPSTYLAHVIFFFSFLFTNAYTVFSLAKEPDASDAQYENRRYRSSMIMALLVLLYILIVYIRFNLTNCESHFGVFFTTLLFGALGVGTYKFAELCGARSFDILGITTMFVNNTSKAPVVCGVP